MSHCSELQGVTVGSEAGTLKAHEGPPGALLCGGQRRDPGQAGPSHQSSQTTMELKRDTSLHLLSL